MLKNLNKGIGVILGLIVITTSVAFLSGGVFIYKKFIQKQGVNLPTTVTQNDAADPFEFPQDEKEVVVDHSITNNWKTYTNNYGFEIKYPTGYADPKEEHGAVSDYGSIKVSINKEKTFSIPLISIVVHDNNFATGIQNLKSFKIGETDGGIICYAAANIPRCKIISSSFNNHIFLISTKYDPLSDKITNQILSTFKFIDPKIFTPTINAQVPKLDSNVVKSAQDQTSDITIKQSLDEIKRVAEFSFDSDGNYKAVCSNQDFIRISNVITSNGGKAICNISSNKLSYAVYSHLIVLATRYYCVDSTGASKVENNAPTGSPTVCW